MGEAFTERESVSPNVLGGLTRVSLREELLALYPERCRNGGGGTLVQGQVCAKIGSFVDQLMGDVSAGEMTDNDALNLSSLDAAAVERGCANGPRYYATATSLKCGLDASNF